MSNDPRLGGLEEGGLLAVQGVTCGACNAGCVCWKSGAACGSLGVSCGKCLKSCWCFTAFEAPARTLPEAFAGIVVAPGVVLPAVADGPAVRFALSASDVGLLVLALREKAAGDRAGADGLLAVGESREESATLQIARGRIAGELRGQAVKLDGWADAIEGESVVIEVRS